jgi:hypothetical protein
MRPNNLGSVLAASPRLPMACGVMVVQLLPSRLAIGAVVFVIWSGKNN